MVQNVFWYLEPFRRGSQLWQTDRRTNMDKDWTFKAKVGTNDLSVKNRSKDC